MATDTEDLSGQVLSACDEDYVGLWEVIRTVERLRPGLPAEEVRLQTLLLIGDLLAADRVVAGFPTPDGRDFDPWAASPADALARIARDWRPGTRPTIGEVVWLTSSANASLTVRSS